MLARPSVALLWFIWPACLAQTLRPIVNLPQGALRGTVLKTSNGRDFYAFQGIPYATPPIGIFRFKEPIPHAGWGGILDAVRFRSECPQYDFRGHRTGEEDCLYVNIYTPALPVTTRRSVTYPVMLWIHGRNYDSGSGNLYGAENLMDKGVILVTFNYRIGVLGFLSTGDFESPGNYGLLDQKLAIGWVFNNIAKFGGDANAVTLFGQGSGAASILLHLLSPSRQVGMFQRVILQSGSPLCDWAIQDDPEKYAIALAEKLGCDTRNSAYIVKCLKEQSTDAIIQAQQELKTFGDFPVGAAPVLDKNSTYRFLPDHPEVLLQMGNFHPVPLMAGVNRDEGAFFYPLIFYKYKEEIRSSSDFLQQKLLPLFLEAATNFRRNVEEVVQELMYNYFGGVNPTNSTQILRPFINMSTDGMYVSCMDKTLQLYSRLETRTFMYSFQYKGTNSFATLNQDGIFVPPVETGVSNGDELFYLFNLHLGGIRPHSHLDNLITNRVLTLWTDFCKFGKAPQFVNYEYPKWDNFRPDRKSYYRIGRSLTVDQDYRSRAVDLWLRRLPEISAADNPTSSPHTQLPGVEPFYRTLAWAMVAICLALLVLVVVLLAILYNQKKSQSFKANHENQSGMSASTLY
uniref:Acetylcholinesterase n=1 Tax=Centruroides hentzi TaxID=88313 RepID=A0A2I9LNG5_9SCOR